MGFNISKNDLRIQIIFISLFLMVYSSVFSQLPGDSLSLNLSSYSKPLLSSYFEKQLRTYNFNQAFKYGYQFNKFFLGISQQFISTIIKSTQQNIKDESYLSLIGQYDLSQPVKVGVNILYNNYADDRQLAINQSSVLNSTLFVKINPIDRLSITPFGGLSQNEQVGIMDSGPIYGAEAYLNNIYLNDFKIYSELKFQNEDISPRKNTLQLFKLDVQNDFESNFRNLLSGLYYQQRIDFYFSADSTTSNEFDIENNIQSRIETRYSLNDRLTLKTNVRGLSVNIDGGIAWREIDRDTRFVSTSEITLSSFDPVINESRLDLNTVVNYTRNIFNGFFRFNFSEREEKHTVKPIPGASEIVYLLSRENAKRKNNIGEQVSLSLFGNFRLSEKDRITFSLFHRKLVYNTPSELNNDDRDELLTMFNIIYFNQINPFFNMFVNLEGNLNKIVYVFKERSANNNTRRVLKLSSGGDIRLSYLTSRNVAEVSANYTVFEFEDLNPNLKSFSFRQLVLRDSTQLKLFRTISFNFLGYIKLSEQGDFSWQGFANKPVRDLEEYYAEPTLQYIYKHISFSVGIRYFSLATYNYDDNNKRIIQTFYRSTAPLAIIRYSLNNYIYISIRGWYEFIKTETSANQQLANLFFRVNWNI